MTDHPFLAELLARYIKSGKRKDKNTIIIDSQSYTVDCDEYGFSKDWDINSKSIRWVQKENLIPVFIKAFVEGDNYYKPSNDIHIYILEEWLWSQGYYPTLHSATHLSWQEIPIPPVYTTLDDKLLSDILAYGVERGEKASTFLLKPRDIKLFRALGRRIFGRRVRSKVIEVCIDISKM